MTELAAYTVGVAIIGYMLGKVIEMIITALVEKPDTDNN